MRVIMVFVDGVGMGRRDPSVNPLFASQLPNLRLLCDGDMFSYGRRNFQTTNSTVIPLDPTLEVSGLPQSGTGQATIFTGVNAAKMVGKHFGPYPYSTLKPVIAEKNILGELLRRKKEVCFANAFPQRFFSYANSERARLTVTTLSCQMSGVRIRNVDDLASGNGISADIDNAAWHSLGHPEILKIDAAEAGHRLARLSTKYDFVLFEYWKTDHAGHAMNMQEAINVMGLFDGLIGGVLAELDLRSTLLVITSDHGNLEDLSIKTHTRNPVPAILFGHRHQQFGELLQGSSLRMSSLTAITPAILRVLS